MSSTWKLSCVKNIKVAFSDRQSLTLWIGSHILGKAPSNLEKSSIQSKVDIYQLKEKDKRLNMVGDAP